MRSITARTVREAGPYKAAISFGVADLYAVGRDAHIAPSIMVGVD